MEYTAQEIGFLMVALRTTPEKQSGRMPTGEIVQIPATRVFDIAQQPTVLSIADKLMKLTEGENEKQVFINGKIDFTTTEKSLLKTVISRPWDMDTIKLCQSVLTKIEK